MSPQKVVKPGQALQNKKKQESNKTMLIWGLIGVGVLVNAVIIYQNQIQIQYPLKDEGNGKFVAEYQGLLKNQHKGCNDLASEMKTHKRQMTSLDLQLGLNGLEGEDIKLLSLGLIHLVNVNTFKISLSHNDIGDEGVYNLSILAANMPSLTTLHLGFDAMKISAETLTTALVALGESKTLKHLTLSLIHSKIQDAGAKALVEGFAGLKSKLETLNLVLISNDLTSEGANSLSDLLPQLENTKSLYLSLYANKIGAEGATHLARGVEKSVQLHDLNLDLFFNNITSIGATSLSGAIGTLGKLRSLKLNLEFNYIEVAGAEAVGKALKQLPQLETLHLNVATKNFGTSGFHNIAEGLQALTNLEELYLHCGVNKLGASGIEDLKLVYARLDKLKRVRLNYYESSLGDVNVARVVQMLEALKKVEHLELNFNFNDLHEHGISQILKAVQKLPALKYLDLDVGQNEINDEQIQIIFDELDRAAQIIPHIKFGFLNTAITKPVSETLQTRYENHPVVKLTINSTVSEHYLEERNQKKNEK